MIQRIRLSVVPFLLGAVALAVVAMPAAAQLASGIDTTNFDHSVRPQDDFFRYVNGGWLKKTEIPADASSWGAFQELRENSRTALHELFENASKEGAKPGSPEKKVGDLYASWMDSARVEQLGTAPLAPELKSISYLKVSCSCRRCSRTSRKWASRDRSACSWGPTPKQSNVNIVQVTQAGLSMPDRDYYLKQDPKMVSTRAAFVEYVDAAHDARQAAGPRGRGEAHSRPRDADCHAAVGGARAIAIATRPTTR